MSNTPSDFGSAAKWDLPGLSHWLQMAKALALIKRRQSGSDCLFYRGVACFKNATWHSYMTLLEVQFLESEVSLNNAGSLNPGPKHVLLAGDVICFSYPLQVVQITRRERKRVIKMSAWPKIPSPREKEGQRYKQADTTCQHMTQVTEALLCINAWDSLLKWTAVWAFGVFTWLLGAFKE